MSNFSKSEESYIEHEVKIRLHDEKFQSIDKSIERLDSSIKHLDNKHYVNVQCCSWFYLASCYSSLS